MNRQNRALIFVECFEMLEVSRTGNGIHILIGTWSLSYTLLCLEPIFSKLNHQIVHFLLKETAPFVIQRLQVNERGVENFLSKLFSVNYILKFT